MSGARQMAGGVDHILLIGYGGPTTPEEVEPFLRHVARGTDVPAERLIEATRHYAVVGGCSRYNEETGRLADALRARLRALGIDQPVLVGMRQWRPWLGDVVQEAARRGHRRGLGVVLAPHRAEASFDRYVRSIDDARSRPGTEPVTYTYLPPWHDHPLFIEAQADMVRRALEPLAARERESCWLVFSAHSVPVAMAAAGDYAEAVATSGLAVARAVPHERWLLAYQSRSGPAREPWLEPDVAVALREAQERGARHVVCVPVGFLCENVEVLFDLDVEARAATAALGMDYARASTVRDHPQFVEMLARLIQEQLRAGRAGGCA